MKDAARDDPRQDQQERKPDQLHPARNLDLRRRAGSHRGHRTPAGRTTSARPGGAEGDPVFWPGVAGFAGDASSPVGLGAGDRRCARAAGPAPDDWFVLVTPTPLKGLADLGYGARDALLPPPTGGPLGVPRGPAQSHAAPGTPGRDGRRDPRRSSPSPAFRPDGGSTPSAPAARRARRGCLPPPPPSGVAIAVYGRLHVASPVNERRGHRDRIPRRRAGTRSRSIRSGARRTSASPPVSSTASSAAAGARASSTTSSAADRGPRPAPSTSGGPRARTSTRRRTARSSGCATTC